MMDKSADEQLWDSFRQGDHSAFETIYTAYVNDLTNYGRRLSEDKDLVKDAIHDLFVGIWQSKENLSSVGAIKYYLLKSLRRNVIKKLSKKKTTSIEFTPAMEHVVDFELSYEMMLISGEEDEERTRSLKREMDNLTSKQKEVIFLKFYLSMSNQEISEMLDINTQSVYNTIYRALEVLRDKLNYVFWIGLQQAIWVRYIN